MTAPAKAEHRHTPRRSVRVPDERWLRATRRASEEGTTVSAAVNAFLDEYGQEPGQES
jgi:macrodomain Ter protein organizer (MatP/YcbG family)